MTSNKWRSESSSPHPARDRLLRVCNEHGIAVGTAIPRRDGVARRADGSPLPQPGRRHTVLGPVTPGVCRARSCPACGSWVEHVGRDFDKIRKRAIAATLAWLDAGAPDDHLASLHQRRHQACAETLNDCSRSTVRLHGAEAGPRRRWRQSVNASRHLRRIVAASLPSANGRDAARPVSPFVDHGRPVRREWAADVQRGYAAVMGRCHRRALPRRRDAVVRNAVCGTTRSTSLACGGGSPHGQPVNRFRPSWSRSRKDQSICPSGLSAGRARQHHQAALREQRRRATSAGRWRHEDSGREAGDVCGSGSRRGIVWTEEGATDTHANGGRPSDTWLLEWMKSTEGWALIGPSPRPRSRRRYDPPPPGTVPRTERMVGSHEGRGQRGLPCQTVGADVSTSTTCAERSSGSIWRTISCQTTPAPRLTIHHGHARFCAADIHEAALPRGHHGGARTSFICVLDENHTGGFCASPAADGGRVAEVEAQRGRCTSGWRPCGPTTVGGTKKILNLQTDLALYPGRGPKTLRDKPESGDIEAPAWRAEGPDACKPRSTPCAPSSKTEGSANLTEDIRRSTWMSMASTGRRLKWGGALLSSRDGKKLALCFTATAIELGGAGAAACIEVGVIDGAMAQVTRRKSARRCGSRSFAMDRSPAASPAGRDLDAEVVAGVKAFQQDFGGIAGRRRRERHHKDAGRRARTMAKPRARPRRVSRHATRSPWHPHCGSVASVLGRGARQRSARRPARAAHLPGGLRRASGSTSPGYAASQDTWSSRPSRAKDVA